MNNLIFFSVFWIFFGFGNTDCVFFCRYMKYFESELNIALESEKSAYYWSGKNNEATLSEGNQAKSVRQLWYREEIYMYIYEKSNRVVIKIIKVFHLEQHFTSIVLIFLPFVGDSIKSNILHSGMLNITFCSISWSHRIFFFAAFSSLYLF